MGIYVEIRIRAPMDALWQHTQQPQLHQRWDLRFSHIDYLPRTTEAEPQRCRYATRIGIGLPVTGEGISIGNRNLPDGSCSSALTFSSGDPRSLILTGSGYWKYIPTEDGVRFLTWYDYQPRFGAVGRIVDRAFFRPILGWATAWSFDRLRLWLERGLSPESAFQQALTRATARLTLVSVFAYQGLVPKLLFHHADELTMLRDVGLPLGLASSTLTVAGGMEIALAGSMLVFWRSRWPAVVALTFAVVATLEVGLRSPGFLYAAFNPVTLNLTVIALALMDLLNLRDAPSAARCLRTLPSIQ